MTYDIPPRRSPEDTPPIKTQDDLCEFWRSLMGPLGFGQRYLWAVFMDTEGRVLPGIINVEGCPLVPDQLMLRNLTRTMVRAMADGRGHHSVAFLWSRPGGAATKHNDIAWAIAINEAVKKALIPIWPIHLANDYDLRVFAPDELAA